MTIDVATVTAKCQVSVPKAIQDNGAARVKVVSPLDLNYLQGWKPTCRTGPAQLTMKPSQNCEA